MVNENIESLLGRLREAFEQEYQRGQKDALRRVVDAMSETGGSGAKAGNGRRGPRPGAGGGTGGAQAGGRGRKAGGRVRARRGAARAFIERILKEKGGATVPQIMTSASSPDEKAVSISAIRFELYRGKKEKRYRNTSGRWSLPGK